MREANDLMRPVVDKYTALYSMLINMISYVEAGSCWVPWPSYGLGAPTELTFDDGRQRLMRRRRLVLVDVGILMTLI
jgi:hypothetical protein